MIGDLTTQLKMLEEVVISYKSEYDAIPINGGGDGFWIRSNWLGPVDAEMLYAMVRRTKPRHVIEIGSGMSTRCIAQALKANQAEGYPCEQTAIDPEPREAIEHVAGVRFIQQPVEEVPSWIFNDLRSGDILFIDSSHIFSPGGDVDVEYHSILPSLRSGVVVHCHDIFLPNGYPTWWNHRGYNEQEHLVWLLNQGGWEILWAGHAIHLAHPEALHWAFASYDARDYPGSFWMRKQ